jgi:hypothetical protein
MTTTILILDGKILRPTRVERSRTGAHGVDYYCLSDDQWSRAWVVTLTESNSGKRYIDVKNVPEDVAELLAEMWIYEGVSVTEIAQVAKLLYMQTQK